MAFRTRAFFKKAYCAHQNRSIACGSIGLRNLHLTYRGIAMIYFAKSILTSQPGGETPHMKVMGMLVVSLRGLNFGFWSHLGCSGQNAIIFSHEGLV